MLSTNGILRQIHCALWLCPQMAFGKAVSLRSVVVVCLGVVWNTLVFVWLTAATTVVFSCFGAETG